MNTSVMIWLFCTILGISLIMGVCFSRRLWARRIAVSSASAALYIVGLVFLLSMPGSGAILAVLSLLQLFLIVAALRIRIDRLHEMHLLHSTLANTSTLVGLAGAVFMLYIADVAVSFVVAATIISFGVMVWSLLAIWQMDRFQHVVRKDEAADRKSLPTVTLAIPARNEDQVLTQSLHAAVTSTYSKLEVLVLDDCSHDRTSNLIKAFAHDGIRFIQGDEPSSDWLGKTRALHLLQQHASGEYIVFADVDTILEPDSIGKMIEYMRRRQFAMISVLPQRMDGLRAGNLFRPLRYYFQMAIPGSSQKAPTVSSLWCIKTSELQKLGGFESVKNRLLPESVFAKQLQRKGAYGFLAGNQALGAHIAKGWISQCETSLRLLYPSCRRQPIVALGRIVLLIILVSPYVFVLYSALVADTSSPWSILASTTALLMSISYAYYLRMSSPRIWPAGLIIFPFLIIQEIVLVLVSMLIYEFGEVRWKDRNVCYPVVMNSEV